MNNKYNIKYYFKFIFQLNEILYYLSHKLNNKTAANNFLNQVTFKINERSLNPKAFEIYKHINNIDWYKLNVKNFTIFYIVRNNTMEIKAIYYSKRNINELL